MQRRVQSRVPLPSIRLDTDFLNSLLAGGPILKFDHLKIDWSDVRFLIGAVARTMRNHEALDEADFRRVEAVCRDAMRLPALVRGWYEGAAGSDGPAAEIKEHLGGYAIVDCADLDEALRWAATVPSATDASVIVRPIVDVEART